MKLTKSTCILHLFIAFLFSLNSGFAQSFEFWYGYTASYHSSGKNSKAYPPKKYVIYISPIFEGTQEEVRQKAYDYRNKYWPIVKKYGNTDPNYYNILDKTTGHSTERIYSIPNLEKDLLKKRRLEINEKRNRIIKRYEDDGYEVIVLDEDSASSKLTTTKTYFSNLKLDDDLYIDGHVTIKSKFVFFGYPYIVAEYQNLTITSIRYKSASYSNATIDKELFSLPYTPKDKPLIDAEFWVWTPKIMNAKPTRKEYYEIFSFPVKRLAAITDNFDNKEVDNYFKTFKHNEKSDSYFWQSSLLQNPKQSSMGSYSLAPISITKITGTLAQDLKTKLKKYNYDSKYDFWGDEKSKPKKEKKSKKDDFWNN